MRIYRVFNDSSPSVISGDWHEADWWERLCRHVKALGFTTVLMPALKRNGVAGNADAPDCHIAALACQRHGLKLMADLLLERAPGEPDVDMWAAAAAEQAEQGVEGFRCLNPGALSGSDWAALISKVHDSAPDCVFLAWTPGLSPADLRARADAGFDATFLSLPWWDYRADWLVQEHDRLRRVAPVIAPVQDDDSVAGTAAAADSKEQAKTRLWTAAFAAEGILVPMGYERLVGESTIIEVNQRIAQRPQQLRRLQRLTGARATITALFRTGEPARLLVINPTNAAAPVDWAMLCSRLPGSYTLPDDEQAQRPAILEAGASVLLTPVKAVTVISLPRSSAEKRKSAAAAILSPRIALENVSPQVDNGQFAIKRTLGLPVHVEADVFMDGHEVIAVSVFWRPADESRWHQMPMQAVGNDRWQADFSAERTGQHCYMVKAWHDVWASHTSGLRKKFAAGADVSLEVEEARQMLSESLERIRDDMPDAATVIASILRTVGQPQQRRSKPQRGARGAGSEPALHPVPETDGDVVEILLSEDVADAMQEVDIHRFESSSAVFPLLVERREACFASWYELFPRSQSSVPGVHGTFQDVIGRLPLIRDMGFDVLYMPPIHPIGQRNRKGRNNALRAGPDDPGSPYAIGSEDGGHDAVHPQLGTLDDFRALVTSAREHGLEIALDFAIQCSPDHPWLARHPDWFDWRADGSLRYAENPPKRYEDIVNPDFYSPLASDAQRLALWRALRDVVLFWADQGVLTFRVDNPHTKPLPFWHWMIAEVQAAHPGALFLSEAFTRPKMMYRLAKVGFSQSYTYFTWRNTKQELTDYMTELNTAPVADFFRPNFFVNTPDINPYFLQTSGRAGFLIRAALATTLSGLWGMYSGFELCEAAAIPGKEEYQDSEKYELRAWDWDRPGNIIDEITRLNLIRRANPALQSHLGIRFHSVDNDQILCFSKATPEGDNVVLVAISLDPYAVQSGTLDLAGTPAVGAQVHELFDDHRFRMHGQHHPVSLTPDRPFMIWSVLPDT